MSSSSEHPNEEEKSSKPNSTTDYVTYGLLDMDQKFVDWFRFDVQSSSSSSSSPSEEEDKKTIDHNERQDELAFADFRKLLSSSPSLEKEHFPINVMPESVSYAVFDSKWDPIRFSPRHTNTDVAMLLHAAAFAEGEELVTTAEAVASAAAGGERNPNRSRRRYR